NGDIVISIGSQRSANSLPNGRDPGPSSKLSTARQALADCRGGNSRRAAAPGRGAPSAARGRVEVFPVERPRGNAPRKGSLGWALRAIASSGLFKTRGRNRGWIITKAERIRVYSAISC